MITSLSGLDLKFTFPRIQDLDIYHFLSVVALHGPTVRCSLVIAQGNFRLEQLYV